MTKFIYIVYNKDNIAVFFTDLYKAQEKIKELKKIFKEFKIRTIKEGELIEADMSF